MNNQNQAEIAASLKSRITEIADSKDSAASTPSHHSDGSELIPAEVKNSSSESSGDTIANGYTVNDEGLVNAYAIEADMYVAESPNRDRQRRYLIQGAIALALVAVVTLIAFSVS